MGTVSYKNADGTTRYISTASSAVGSSGDPDINRTQANDGDLATIGAKADSLATNSSSAWSLVALLKGVWDLLSGVKASTDNIPDSISAGDPDSGSPLKVGARYSTVLPSYEDGDRTDLQSNANGGLLVDLQTRLDSANDSIKAEPQAAATGGATWFPAVVSAANNNATLVKDSPGTLYAIVAANYNLSSARYIKFYDKATAPSPGSDTPLFAATLPKASDAESPQTLVMNVATVGSAFTTGVAFAIVGGKATNDNTSVSSGDVLLNLLYK